MKVQVKRGNRMWYWACYACSQGDASRKWTWREAFDRAFHHAKSPGHPK